MDATVEFSEEFLGGRDPVNTEVDLLVYDVWGRSSRYPLKYDLTNIGTPVPGYSPDIELQDPKDSKVRVELRWDSGRLFVLNKSLHLQVLVNGQASTHRELYDRDNVQIGGLRFKVVGLRAPVAMLEGYTPPHDRQRWMLKEGLNQLGRGGSRPNEVELDDATVSRSHATLRVREDGVSLENETPKSVTKVNSRRVAQSQVVDLGDGDLLQFGRQLLRIRMSKEVRTVGTPIEIAVLGVRITCDPALHPADKKLRYRQAFECLMGLYSPNRDIGSPAEIRDQKGWDWLPYIGGNAYAIAEPQSEMEPPSDRLVILAKGFLERWIEKGLDSQGVHLAVALHLGTADQQPPSHDYATARRTIETVDALLGLVGSESSRFVISRAGWQACRILTTTQRIGVTQVWGHWTPVEAYFADLTRATN